MTLACRPYIAVRKTQQPCIWVINHVFPQNVSVSNTITMYYSCASPAFLHGIMAMFTTSALDPDTLWGDLHGERSDLSLSLGEGFVGQHSLNSHTLSKVNHSTFVNTSASRNCTMFTHNQLTKKCKHNIYDQQQQLEKITSAFCQQKKSHKICYLTGGLKFVA